MGNKHRVFYSRGAQGIADAFLICEKFIDKDNVCLILGDNIFYGELKLEDTITNFKTGAHIFTYFVEDPQNFGVLDIHRNKVIDIKKNQKNLLPTI